MAIKPILIVIFIWNQPIFVYTIASFARIPALLNKKKKVGL